ncbi:hypothetical protein AB0C76_13145 [Kitasatospora sp. NPDC048722]|uniref:hypothetical protein n=1 Tax=Kitasatospora sp. NPDC048722 TaxID=3155639 RepID=UPI0033D39C2C
MTTTTETPDTAGAQINAAGVLLSLLSAHSALPTATVELQYLRVPGTHDFRWGLEVALHNGLDHFEQWRQALGIDPGIIDHDTAVAGTLAWLTATITHSGVPVKLIGFYYQPEPATSGE